MTGRRVVVVGLRGWAVKNVSDKKLFLGFFFDLYNIRVLESFNDQNDQTLVLDGVKIDLSSSRGGQDGKVSQNK